MTRQTLTQVVVLIVLMLTLPSIASAVDIAGHSADAMVPAPEVWWMKVLWLGVGVVLNWGWHTYVPMLTPKAATPRKAAGAWMNVPRSAQLVVPALSRQAFHLNIAGERFTLTPVLSERSHVYCLVECDDHEGVIGVALIKYTSWNKTKLSMYLREGRKIPSIIFSR